MLSKKICRIKTALIVDKNLWAKTEMELHFQATNLKSSTLQY